MRRRRFDDSRVLVLNNPRAAVVVHDKGVDDLQKLRFVAAQVEVESKD